MRDVLL